MNSEYFSAYSSLFCVKHKSPANKSNNIMRLATTTLFLCCSFQMAFHAAFATNYYIEEQISYDLQQSKDKGEIIWLESDNQLKTIALFKEAQGIETLGSILILADLNNPPNWSHIIQPLRKDLAIYGWNTLSILMPIKEKNVLIPQLENIYKIAENRIKSAIDYLTKNHNPNIIIIGRRHSANIAIKYLADNKEESDRITAFVSISSFDSPWINSSQIIKNMPIPYLDVYAQNDTTEVIKAVPKRLIAARFAGQKIKKEPKLDLSAKVQQLAKNKTGNLHFRQAEINGASSNFAQQYDALLKTIRGWLKNYEKNDK